MKKIILTLVLCFLIARPAMASEVSSPPHLVINFAGVNDLDWDAPEDKWQSEVKPTVEEQIRAMHATVQPRLHEDNTPILAWSTLMEYMNFPMDTPSDASIYAVKMRRILEIAENLDFPVFIPLNGFQWWDQLPELYNWWDPDGTQTDPKFFARQKNPEQFKSRFIAGYDPDNDLNVEWQSSRSPMKLGYRNWGGGGFRLAPPPNLLSPKFQKLQQARLKVILAEITKKKSQWDSENKGYLFAGLSIGTEISLNASVTPADEFKPYGFRSSRDLGCADKIVECRSKVLQTYLETTSQFVNRTGIPKDKIFTHVYGEADPKDSHYAPYADSAFNLYSNPGSSFYGHKDDPLASAQWSTMVKKYGHPTWGAIEYSDTPSAVGLTKTLADAKLVDIYNWDSVKSNPQSIKAIQSALTVPVKKAQCTNENSLLHVQRGVTARLRNEEIPVSTISALPYGIYSWYTETKCGTDTVKYSAPQIYYVPVPTPVETTPGWVKWIMQLLYS